MTTLQRSQHEVLRSVPAVLFTFLALGAAMAACGDGNKPSDTSLAAKGQQATGSLIPGTNIGRLRECPHAWKRFVASYRGAGPDSTLRAVGNRTDVVEYHDCQKFITPRGTDYNQLVAIFAGVTVTRQPSELVAATANSPIALASALILDFDDEYKNLGIQSGFNCLYIYYGGGDYIGRIKPFGGTEPDCQPPADIDELPNKPKLRVLESQLPGGSAGGYTTADVPPVARWDYDAAPGKPTYYAGLKCGARWCEVGPEGGFNPSLGRAASSPGLPKNQRRVTEIKGWHDYQRLAIKDATGSYPSDLAAFVTPDGDLGTRGPEHFVNKWVHTATVELSGSPGVYETKLGFGPASPSSALNHLWICNNNWAECLLRSREAGGPAEGTTGAITEPVCKDADNPKTWWALVVNPSKGVAYRCVYRTDHGNIPVPGTARWRWVLSDETIWVRCANGCCQVDQV